MAIDLALVVVDFNGVEDTRKCLRSMEAADLAGAPVIVIDNGSTPSTADAIRPEFPWATIVRREENGGWAGGNNEGIRIALEMGARRILLLNNDVVIARDLVGRMLEAARAHPEFGVLGPVINFMDEPGTTMTDGVVFNAPGPAGTFFARREVVPGGADVPAVVEVDIVNGCALMVSAEVLAAVGLIDDRFFLIHEESDLCLRAMEAGYRCGVVSRTLVWHKGSSSFKRSGTRLQRYYDARNLALLLRKHASLHRRGRSVFTSWLEYARYVYYIWCVEREAAEHDSARAVLEGILDALRGRFGPYRKRARPGLGALQAAFSIASGLRGKGAAT